MKKTYAKYSRLVISIAAGIYICMLAFQELFYGIYPYHDSINSLLTYTFGFNEGKGPYKYLNEKYNLNDQCKNTDCIFSDIYPIIPSEGEHFSVCSRWTFESCMFFAITENVTEHQEIFNAIQKIISFPCDFLPKDPVNRTGKISKHTTIGNIWRDFKCDAPDQQLPIAMTLFDKNYKFLTTTKYGQ